MPAKKRLLCSHLLHAEADALRVDHAQVPSETNSDEYIYDSDEDKTLLRPTSSSSLLVPLAPIVLGNSVTENIEPIASGNRVAPQPAPTVLGSPVTNPVLTMSEAADIMDSPILQMGNVVQNDPPIAKRAPEQTEQTVFNMRHAVFLSDTVDKKLAKAFLIQARDPAFKGHYETHRQKTALRLIRLRLHDVTYRSLVPIHEIAIWPKKTTTSMGGAASGA